MRGSLAIAQRLLRQLRHDHRSLGLLLGAPLLLMTLLRFLFDGQPALFDRVGAPLLGLFPLIIMFLITSVAMLRERSSGTLEQLLAAPIGRGAILAGYGSAFALVAALQSLAVAAFTLALLEIQVAGPLSLLLLFAVGNGLLGMALGLLLSAFATTEFQAVQFMPALIMPQLLLCGLIAPRAQMAPALDLIAGWLPMTYAYDGLQRVAGRGEGIGAAAVRSDLLVVYAVVAAALLLASLTLRRRTA